MKLLEVPPLELRLGLDLTEAVDLVFSRDVLRRVHGPDTAVPPFVAGRRTFEFGVDVSAVPRPLRMFFSGSRLRATTRQVLLRRLRDECVVVNHVKMHFVGAELFRIEPTFTLRRDFRGGVTLDGAVRHTALLPWPLKGMAERFMASQSEKELRAYADVLRDYGAVDE